MEQRNITQIIPPNSDWRAVYSVGALGTVRISNRPVAVWAIFDSSVVRGLAASPDGGLKYAEEDPNFLGYAANLEQVSRFESLAVERYLDANPDYSLDNVKTLYLS